MRRRVSQRKRIEQAANHKLTPLVPMTYVQRAFQLNYTGAVEAKRRAMEYARLNGSDAMLKQRIKQDRFVTALSNAEKRYPGLLREIVRTGQKRLKRVANRYASRYNARRLSRARVSQISSQLVSCGRLLKLSLHKVATLAETNDLPITAKQEFKRLIRKR